MRSAKHEIIIVMIILLVLVFMPQQALAAEYGVNNPIELAAALGSVTDGDTIRLLADIDYTSGMIIAGMTVTLDMNGHMLNVTNSAGNGLDVGAGGVLNITGSGSFNVTSGAANCYGVNAHDGGRATVTNASATGLNGVGAHAIGSGSYVQVKGNATSSGNTGALARNNGTVIVGGNAEGVTGADAVGSDTTVEVAGNVTGSKGVACAMGATVRVSGNVIATGNCLDPRAVAIVFGGNVFVSGNVTASGTGTVGAWIYDGGTITIDGTLNAPTFIVLQDAENKVTSGVPGTAPYEGYLVYINGSNTVRVGRLLSAVIDPASTSFDKNPSKSADTDTTVTWNNATSVTDIKSSGTSIGAANYSISGNSLKIKKEYLAANSPGNLTLSVEFDTGDPAALTIAISDSTPITGLPDSYIMYVGGRAAWSPLPEGGSWSWDNGYFSKSSDSTATFTALKAGTSVVTYSVNGISHSIAVTINETTLPKTGQDDTIIFVLVLLAVLSFAGAAALKTKRIHYN